MARQNRPYRLTRDLHLYAGLFVSPFVLVYAISAVILNHTVVPWGGEGAPVETRTVNVRIAQDTNSLMVARQLRDQLGVPGEIGFVTRNRRNQRISFPIETPGVTTSIRVDLSTGVATLERKATGMWSGLVYLHKIPGPHNVNVRGNWMATKAWGWAADASVYLLLFVSASGIYLWGVLRAERKAGFVFLGAGAVTFFLLLGSIVG